MPVMETHSHTTSSVSRQTAVCSGKHHKCNRRIAGTTGPIIQPLSQTRAFRLDCAPQRRIYIGFLRSREIVLTIISGIKLITRFQSDSNSLKRVGSRLEYCKFYIFGAQLLQSLFFGGLIQYLKCETSHVLSLPLPAAERFYKILSYSVCGCVNLRRVL